ncbi:MAG: matrixin family metalloprotease [Nanoarchaeota archaeon]|nr:matrixin family metalloprotease [Nanoarchaeota archaeon]MBU1027703.1 matrixin family metalloprotease [Nanoarchaeota archaeon]
MGWKAFLSFLFFLLVIALLILYWFIPFDTVEFGTSISNPNFNLNSTSLNNMQFYSNLRYPDSEISYKIYDECTLQKKQDMERAFEIISNLTVLKFYSVNFNEGLSIFCDEKNKIENDLFIAGEGGPVNITQTDNFNVIFNARILLIQDFRCDIPNVAIHELLHALGFDHSSNKNNIMYPVTKCGQSIGEDIPYWVNYLYSFETLPDLSFENISAVMKGKYLDAEISIRNNGLKKTESVKIVIYADGKIIKEIPIESLEIGSGKIISLANIWITQLSIDEIKFVIDSNFDELDKSNNVAVLKTKK